MASKGQKFRHWSAEEKYEIIKPALEFNESATNISNTSHSRLYHIFSDFNTLQYY